MENQILLFTILGLTFVTALSQLFIILIKSSKHNNLDQNLDESDEYLLKAQQIIHDAQEKANRILVNAELKGIEYASRQKLDITKIQEDYVKSIKELERNLIEQFKSSLENADKSYKGFLEVIEENLRQQELENQRLFREKTNRLVDSTQTTMITFIKDVNSKVAGQIDMELKALNNELDMYKNRRMEIINKYIIDILERTLEETLGKKLSLNEHSEIIFDALEKAKNEMKL